MSIWQLPTFLPKSTFTTLNQRNYISSFLENKANFFFFFFLSFNKKNTKNYNMPNYLWGFIILFFEISRFNFNFWNYMIFYASKSYEIKYNFLKYICYNNKFDLFVVPSLKWVKIFIIPNASHFHLVEKWTLWVDLAHKTHLYEWKV